MTSGNARRVLRDAGLRAAHEARWGKTPNTMDEHKVDARPTRWQDDEITPMWKIMLLADKEADAAFWAGRDRNVKANARAGRSAICPDCSEYRAVNGTCGCL